jgi:hypothetical protein
MEVELDVIMMFKVQMTLRVSRSGLAIVELMVGYVQAIHHQRLALT